MKIAVVGGGWAGLSAAVTAVKLGHDVHLFESAPVLGGRARSTHVPALDADIDNGQHILLGAYTHTLALMRELGLRPEERFHRLPLSVRSANGALELRAFPILPAPLHIAMGVLFAKGLAWRERRAALRAMSVLRRQGWRTPPGATVQQWLDDSRQPARLQQRLWLPLCIATMNTPASQACAQLFANVLRDSLGASRRGASDMLIPRTALTALWPAQVEALAQAGSRGEAPGGTLQVLRSTTVRHLGYAAIPQTGSPSLSAGSAVLTVDDRDERYDAVVVCANTPSSARLLSTLPRRPGSEAFVNQLNAFDHGPIATLTVEFERAWKAPAPMLLLNEDRQRNHFGQWLFQGQDTAARLLHVVISDAGAISEVDRKTVVAAIIQQLREQLGEKGLPAVTRHALIVEKRATFLAVPGLRRPGNATPWPGVWVAGDWTDTGYPAVLEGAVRSGREAVWAIQAKR